MTTASATPVDGRMSSAGRKALSKAPLVDLFRGANLLLVIAGVLIMVGAALGPETRDVDMTVSEPAGMLQPPEAASQ